MAVRPGAAAQPRRPHLRLVRGDEVPGRRRPLRAVLVPVAAVLVLAIFAVAALQAYVGQEGFELSRLEEQVERSEERYALLRARVAELSSPDRIRERGAELGLEGTDPVFLPSPDGLEEDPEDGGYAAKRLLTGVP